MIFQWPLGPARCLKITPPAAKADWSSRGFVAAEAETHRDSFAVAQILYEVDSETNMR